MDTPRSSRRQFVLACGCAVGAVGANGTALGQQTSTTGPVVPPPEGWSYLPELGVKNIYSLVKSPPSDEPSPQIKVTTRRDVGILEKQVDVPLAPATTLRWMWNVKKLPSQIAENVTPAHDYLSIAAKFDNGQDITYMFSSTLPVGTGFHCPLRNWIDRETHVVLHSGSDDLGKWLSEERTLLADYNRYVARGEPPRRITQVWLIANSSIQKTEGDADFAKISLGEKTSRLEVL